MPSQPIVITVIFALIVASLLVFLTRKPYRIQSSCRTKKEEDNGAGVGLHLMQTTKKK